MPNQNQANKRRATTIAPGNGHASAKRSRVSRACDQCRTAREKCDGQPVCSTCSTSNRACTYTANPKKRGIQPGYIRTLELGLTWLFKNSDAEALLNRKLVQEGASSVLFGKDTKESNRLHRSWRKSRFCKDLDRLLSGGDIDEQRSQSPDSEDQDSGTESPSYQEPSGQSRIDPTVSGEDAEVLPGLEHPGPTLRPRLEATPLPASQWKLLDIYFAYTHCWFPICEQHDLLKLSYSYPEQGILLSADMTRSEDHAELWSILALASLQGDSSDSEQSTSSGRGTSPSPIQIYDTARALIPYESGRFKVGHVKALLILALVNISQGLPEAAWLLIGNACRILVGLEFRDLPQASRYRHVFAGCFILDSLVSIQLRRRPYLRISDVERVGKIAEDGLEEWSPWTGGSTSLSAGTHPRAPVLSLSTFNHMVELIGILNVSVSSVEPSNSLQEAIERLAIWKTSLAPPFDHIRTERVAIPPTPPAILLQMLYCCCCLDIYASQSWGERIIDLVERLRASFSSVTVPPLVDTILAITQSNGAYSSFDENYRIRLHSLRMDLSKEWSRNFKDASRSTQQTSPIHQAIASTTFRSTHSRRSFDSTTQLPTPRSLQIPLGPQVVPDDNLRTSSTLLDELLPDMNPASVSHQQQNFGFSNAPALREFNNSQLDSALGPTIVDYTSSATSRDVTNFFDELAYLDSAERAQNQPQFMQNLGFAPDASIADLLMSDYDQLNQIVSPYVQQRNNNPPMDQTQYFDGS